MTNQEKNREAILSKVKALSSILTEYTSNLKEHNATQIAEELLKDKKVSLNLDYLRKIVAEFCRQNNIALPKGKRTTEVPPEFKDPRVKGSERPLKEKQVKEKDPEAKEEKQTGSFIVKDKYVINHSNKTIVTDLGEFGLFMASFERHGLIQKSYVTAGDGETGAIVAMQFNFEHPNAVYRYAKIHGFTKSSIPQTDISLQYDDLSEEEAVEENIQSLKKRIYNKTQVRKWQETEKAASNWWNFENTVVETLKLVTSELDTLKPEQLQFIVPDTNYPFASLIGISDAHYLKICYNHKGEITYNREIARERIKEHTIALAEETARYGKPETFFVLVGNDNMHVDGLHHGTTKFTPQTEATDGLWRLELKNYYKIQIEMINYLKQIAPVTLLPVKGNHDYQTSIALHAHLSIYYENDDLVNVIECHDDRVYYQYRNICLVATHGDELRSIAKLEREAHKLIMSEAKSQGINTEEIDYYIIIHGHMHPESCNDLGGNVQRVGLKSSHLGEDIWHKQNGFIGRNMGSQLLIMNENVGKKALMYV